MGLKLIIDDKVKRISEQLNGNPSVEEEVWDSTISIVDEFRGLTLPLLENLDLILEINFQEKTLIVSGEPEKKQVPRFTIELDFKNRRRESLKIEAKYASLQLRNNIICDIDHTRWNETISIPMQENPSNKEVARTLLEAIWKATEFFYEEIQKASRETQMLSTAIHNRLVSLPILSSL
ncbi:MAG: hypothetical protein PHQ47_00450 [Candidatus Portnoybacteria bacterium]|nr:hypothetical protein [Candidatus Portnoybacteria bacterium]